MRIELRPRPLTREVFAPFGEVIDVEGSEFFWINGGATKRYHKLAAAQVDEGSQVIISIFEATPYPLPLRIELLERHPKGSQAFMPLLGNDYLVVVAPKAKAPQIDQICAFYAKGSQGVNYYADVWHHPLIALHNNDRFLVVDRDGAGSNCDEHHFDAHAEILLTLS